MIKYIDDNKMLGKVYNMRKMVKEVRKLDLPDYKMQHVDFSCKYNMVLSERARAKTTTYLLLSLLMYREYGCTTAYFRTHKDLIAPSNLVDIFGVINEYNYIERIFGEGWNYLKYDKRNYYLCQLDENGEIIKQDYKPIIHCMSVDRMEWYKSTFNDPNCDIILYDEFIDEYHQNNSFENFMHCISTIFRSRKSGMIFMLANTIEIEHPYFYEFDIHEELLQVERGQSLVCANGSTRINVFILEELSGQKKRLRNEINNLYFSFKNHALTSITGEGTWDIKQYPHIYLLDEYEILERPQLFLYVDYRGMLIRLELVIHDKMGACVYVTPATRIYEDSKMLTMQDIKDSRYIFGIPRNNLLVNTFFHCYDKNKFYYANNATGRRLENFIKDVKVGMKY